ncbi:hypothetical protein SH580_19675 [Coraliomargarita algicola]|uniref:LITAF domain-containing protein n=1 Tax=Coraliomargarita algicola TaxID=3092156 RepID=A0ABZ0RJR1_9BACT|nr:hypothetical protein [Coraliomargarita sp. J2-16]WPJ95641.1 hypothetical protein SH580_19675 [Coraliomargarita sp. J2-16]
MAQHLPKYICANCGSTTDKPVSHTKGSLALEVLLWLCFLLPGLLYSVWRISSRSKVCPSCKSDSIIPTSTPKGTALLRDNLYKS